MFSFYYDFVFTSCFNPCKTRLITRLISLVHVFELFASLGSIWAILHFVDD